MKSEKANVEKREDNISRSQTPEKKNTNYLFSVMPAHHPGMYQSASSWILHQQPEQWGVKVHILNLCVLQHIPSKSFNTFKSFSA